jgi:hypothetical protein
MNLVVQKVSAIRVTVMYVSDYHLNHLYTGNLA